MTDVDDAGPVPGLRGVGLATKLFIVLALACAIILLTGLTGWWTLQTVLRESGAAAGADADVLKHQLYSAGLRLAGATVIGIVLLSGLYLYCIHAVVGPLRHNARALNRLAAGDCDENVSADQLARGDELGDLARAIHHATARQRAEVARANDMTAGDFSGVMAVRDPADALGQAIRRMAGVTVDALRRVDAHAGRMLSGCEAIVSAGGDLSSDTDGIAAEVEEISDGIAQVQTHAADNAGVAEEAGRLSNTGTLSIERGYEDVGEMGVVMLNMQSCGDKIVRIAKSIGDIAFQTNLLALNASVEAARAGRNGKGFTIVAGEVRNLAVRTRKAAEETSTLMKETVEQVELAASIAGRINATFTEMQTNIQEGDQLLSKIIAASRDQSGGIDRISASLRRVDASARANKARVGDVLENANSLIEQSERLRRAMGRFRLDFGEDIRLPHAVRDAEQET